ncbi:amidohydrolase family protein [candidate division KSB1 bacterium]|nr:amidohydrolase family protein [candidate division KSB1 bacterium]
MPGLDHFIVKNAWICQVRDDSLVPVFGEIEVEHGKIAGIRPQQAADGTDRPDIDDGTQYDAGCRIITLPLINFHHHFYSQLVKGLPFDGDMYNFEGILENLWWKLDQQLDLDAVRTSAQLASLESIRHGVTYIFDHHSSPAAIHDSLASIKDVIEQFRLRAVLCYETSDRNGAKNALDALHENEQFARLRSSADIKSMLGLHASFTLSDETLRKASDILEQQHLGIHIHLCEDEIDREISIETYRRSPVERLIEFKLLNSRGILTHGVHLNDGDYRDIARFGTAIAYNPDSNLNNAVGLPRFAEAPLEIPILVGTDGMHSNIARSIKQLFLLYRHLGGSSDATFAWIRKIYFDQLGFIKRYFEDYPSLQIGDRADFIVWDYVPPNRLTPENVWSHFIYGALECPVRSVLQGGAFLMKEFQLQHIDESAVYQAACEQGGRLYRRIDDLRDSMD